MMQINVTRGILRSASIFFLFFFLFFFLPPRALQVHQSVPISSRAKTSSPGKISFAGEFCLEAQKRIKIKIKRERVALIRRLCNNSFGSFSKSGCTSGAKYDKWRKGRIRRVSLTRVRKRLTQIGNSLNRNGSRLDLDPTLLVPCYHGDRNRVVLEDDVVGIEDFS